MMTVKIYPNVLIVSSDEETVRAVLEVLAAKSIRGMVVPDPGSGRDKLEDRPWELLFVDVQDLGDRGFELLSSAKEQSPELPVVMIGCGGDVQTAVRAMHEGCEDFLTKPVDRTRLETLLETLLPNHDVPLAAAAESNNRPLYQIVGTSPIFLETMRLAGKVASASVPILITGESGTGKELISYYLHRESHRHRGPYIRVNCAAISETLLESELFGHERGAFTGAYTQRKGRFERAHGGTLLLDEISETGPRLQAELLRVLEQQDFERLGGGEPVRVNVRVISTTNRDLLTEVERGRFRLDLYYRIGGVRVPVPPLRNRKEDIAPLVWYFVNQYAREAKRRITQLDAEMIEIFLRCHWPGNVRQLKSAVRTALILGSGPTLSLKDAPHLKAELLSTEPPPKLPSPSLKLQELERRAILEALRRTSRNQAKAARLLGITDRTLREKLRRYRRNGDLHSAGEDRWATETISSTISKPV